MDYPIYTRPLRAYTTPNQTEEQPIKINWPNALRHLEQWFIHDEYMTDFTHFYIKFDLKTIQLSDTRTNISRQELEKDFLSHH